MKPLPEKFTKNGFHHEQVTRRGDLAVFRRWKDGVPHHFETIRIKSHNGYALAGVNIEPAEVYPSSEQWGVSGFTNTSLERAMSKLEQLEQS